MFRNYYDSHVRPNNSPGGQDSVVYLAEQAEMAGLMGIAILDHVDCGRYFELDFKRRIAQTVIDVARAGAGFRRRIVLTRGIELIIRPEDYKTAEEAAGLCPYDFVAAGCRFDPGEEKTVEVKDAGAVLDRHFGELAELCEWGRFDILTGLARPLEWAAASGITFDPGYFEERIAGIFGALIKKGKGIMLNPAGSPLEKIIKLYKKLGGEIVTIGSGACRAEDLGSGVKTGMNAMLDAGFEAFTFFRAGKPQALKII